MTHVIKKSKGPFLYRVVSSLLNCTKSCTHYSSLSCVNEYLAIDSGGYSSEQPSCINCGVAECLPEKLRWHLIEQVSKGSNV